MLVHSLASKYARFVVIVRQIYWTPPSDHWTPPLLKSDDLFFREPRDIGPPLSKILDTPLDGEIIVRLKADIYQNSSCSMLTDKAASVISSWAVYGVSD